MTLDQLKSTCENCQKCPLGATRTNLVFGVGNPHAKLMFVGEAPGEQEDLSGIPFVGRAGQLLDKFLYAVDIDRADVYIANILKCRPPKNRDPLPAEEDACMDFLRRQVKLINPKIIAFSGEQREQEGCLSNPGEYGITKRPKAVTVRATDRHGKEYELNGTDLLARAICHELDHLDGKLFKDFVIEFVDAD